MPRFFYTVGACCANPDTATAVFAGSRLVLKLPVCGYCFGIVTPLAQEAATFKKDRGPGAGTVVKRKTLNIGNCAAKRI
jgi:hypothetical protein